MSFKDDAINQLPDAYRHNDEVLSVIFGAVAPAVDAATGVTDAWLLALAPDDLPAAWLDSALDLRGWPRIAGVSDYTKRQVLKKLLGWFQTYGQPGVFEDIVATYTKTSAAGTGAIVAFDPRSPVAGGYRVGRGYVGAAYVWQWFSSCELRVRVVTAASDPAANTDFILLVLRKTLPPQFLIYGTHPIHA